MARRSRRGRPATLLAALVVLALLAVAAVVADRTARSRTAEAVAAQLQRDAALPAAPQVSFPGGSFLLQVARGRFETVTATAAEASAQGVAARDVRVRLDDVVVPRGVLLGRAGTATARGGTASALLPFPGLEERLAAQGIDATLTADGADVRATSALRALGREVDVAVVVAPRLDGDVLRLQPVSASAAGLGLDLAGLRRLADRAGVRTALDGVDVALPALPPGVRPRDVRVVADGVVVTADLAALPLPIAP